jgi:hypothetical protein
MRPQMGLLVVLLVVVAGCSNAGSPTWTPAASPRFVDVGSTTTARDEPMAVRLNDGRVLVAGGDGPAGTLASAELPSTRFLSD